MSKDTFYFSHDYNVRSDIKIQRLISKTGYLGYGLFWALVENLYNNANALPLDYDVIAFDLRTDSDVIKTIINDFDLFFINDNYFGSYSVQRRLDQRNEKSEKARKSANDRWERVRKDTNALQTQSDSNAIKEKKVNKSIDNILLSEIKISDDTPNKEYYLIAKSFQELFIKNREENGIKSHKNLHNAKYLKWTNEIKLMIEKDNLEMEQLRQIYIFLNSETKESAFWKPNIQSIEKLREQSDKLIQAMKKEEKDFTKPFKKQNTPEVAI